MQCSRCGAEMKIKNVQVGVDRNGNPIYHKYAYCYNCRIKRNLEKGTQTIPFPKKRKKNRRRKQKRLLAFTLLLSILLLIGGVFFYKKAKSDAEKENNNTITHQHNNIIEPKDFRDLKLGMSQSEIEETIGSEGSLLTRTTINNSLSERYQWVTKNGEGTVLLTFLDQKLISLSQTGMKDDEMSQISESAIQKLKYGMSLVEVHTALNSNGIRISETINDGITTSVYVWHNDNANTIYSAIFIDDYLQYVSTKKDVD